MEIRKTENSNPYEQKEIKFFGRNFYIDQRVYVPTLETELFVKESINIYKQLSKSGEIVDVGTGCGAVGITLAKELKTKVTAVDISKDALDVAEINKKKYFSGKEKELFKILQSDYIQEIKENPALIVADLPWGSSEYLLDSNKAREWNKMPEVSFFPKEGGPMGCYKTLVDQIIKKRWKTILCIETGNMPEDLVRSELPAKLEITYKKVKDNYSITTIEF